jgi:hypothetical protein
VVEKLKECSKRGPVPLQPVKHTVSFDVFMDSDGQVEQVALRDSTLHLDDVEACMERVLHAVSERAMDASLRRHEPASLASLPPETRALFGHPAVVGVGVVEVAIVIGVMVVTVVVYYQVVRNTKTHRPPPSRPQVEEPPKPEPPKPEPKTGGDPETTDPPPPPPPPPPRRYPNQKCENDELDRLEKEMHQRCDVTYAATCGGKVNKKELPLIPCSAIKRSIEQRRICVKHRWLVQEKCFGGVPDAVHKKVIDEAQGGIDRCEALKLLNGAKGHPMAGLEVVE